MGQTGLPAVKVKEVVRSQYLAALAMLKQAVVQCPPQVWDDPQDRDRFWFVAYHTLYYAHRYLKAQDKGYTRWEKRLHSRQGTPFSKKEILERFDLVERDVVEQINLMKLDEQAHAGFLANKFELQLYNIRHIQQHAGELYERLNAYEVKLNWVSERHRLGPSWARSGLGRHDAASPKETKR